MPLLLDISDENNQHLSLQMIESFVYLEVSRGIHLLSVQQFTHPWVNSVSSNPILHLYSTSPAPLPSSLSQASVAGYGADINSQCVRLIGPRQSGRDSPLVAQSFSQHVDHDQL